MLPLSNRKSSASTAANRSSHRLNGDTKPVNKKNQTNGKSTNLKPPSSADRKNQSRDQLELDSSDERQRFLSKDRSGHANWKANLAKQETIEELDESDHLDRLSPCSRLMRFIMRKRIFIPLLLLAFIAAIYCLPYVEIEPDTTKKLPSIPFNFQEPPLKASSASLFKAQKLFKNQIHGPESMAIDSLGNMYLAIEGGFVLYGHLNRSSPMRRAFQEISDSPLARDSSVNLVPEDGEPAFELIRIAELNAIKQIPYEQAANGRRRARDETIQGSWRRECQLDEKIYGQNLYSMLSEPYGQSTGRPQSHFRSNVLISRCSKPLGIRLSPDESSLYIIDTLNGLFKVNLMRADKGLSGLRQVSKLIDFRGKKTLPVLMLNAPVDLDMATSSTLNNSVEIQLRAMDDIAVDWGAGSKGTDVIYISLASQRWDALSFLYDLLEGRPSGRLLRFDVGANQLVIMDPQQVNNVRYSADNLDNVTSMQHQPAPGGKAPKLGYGAPRLDENDIFDDRPLHFPNGIELTDDRTAILLAETSGKRILKHYIRGPRVGQTDLWAWTPQFPDNIRRGADKLRETYWVVGCGREPKQTRIDQIELLQPWPMVRKLVLKSIHLFGWLVEKTGEHLFKSQGIRDYGYSLKFGHALLENSCAGMMIIQYDKHGNILRSIHGPEFPHDIYYFSQVNEVIEPTTNKHVLYLGSPGYSYVTKLTLPIESPTPS